MKLPSPSLYVFLSLTLVTGGCNKHKILEAEREKLDSERTALIKEMSDIDAKIQALPEAYHTAKLEKELETNNEQAAKLEAEAEELMKKWTAIETRLQPLKKEAEEYKARYSR